jgi:hypothetical protein
MLGKWSASHSSVPYFHCAPCMVNHLPIAFWHEPCQAYSESIAVQHQQVKKERERSTQGWDVVPFPREVKERARGYPSVPYHGNRWECGRAFHPPTRVIYSFRPLGCLICMPCMSFVLCFLECLDGCGIASHKGLSTTVTTCLRVARRHILSAL